MPLSTVVLCFVSRAIRGANCRLHTRSRAFCLSPLSPLRIYSFPERFVFVLHSLLKISSLSLALYPRQTTPQRHKSRVQRTCRRTPTPNILVHGPNDRFLFSTLLLREIRRRASHPNPRSDASETRLRMPQVPKIQILKEN